MNLHHAAALALVGWYLMTPQISGDYRVLNDSPLAEYHEEAAYDSAAECETAKRRLLDFAKKTLNDPKTDKLWEAKAKSLFDGVCVSSDDPRLKPN